MDTVNNPGPATGKNPAVPTAKFPPLDQLTQPNLRTEQAAHYLNRRPQTLRGWACSEDGPLRPLRINGRLAWPVSEIRRVTGFVMAAKMTHNMVAKAAA